MGTSEMPSLERLRDVRGLDQVIGGWVGAASEATPCVEHIELDLFGLQPDDLRDRGLVPDWNCSPFQTSQPVAVSLITQSSGSIAACAR